MELTVICERCLKYCDVECVQGHDGMNVTLFLVSCHGRTRLVDAGHVPMRRGTGGGRALFEHLHDHVSDPEEMISACNKEIERLQRLVAAAKKVTP